MFQIAFIVIGVGIIVFYILEMNVPALLGNLDPVMYTVGAYGPVFMLCVTLLIAPMLLVRPDLWQRIRAAENAQTAKPAFFISAPIVAGAFFLFTLVGMLAKGAGLNQSGSLLLELLGASSGGGLVGIAHAVIVPAFVGAVISSLDSLMNIASISMVRAVEGERAAESGTGAQKYPTYVVIVTVIGLVLAYVFRNIVDVFVAAVSFMMVISPPVLQMIFGYKPTESGAFWGVVCGLVVLLVLVFIIPKTAFVPAVGISWLVYLGVAIWERKGKR